MRPTKNQLMTTLNKRHTDSVAIRIRLYTASRSSHLRTKAGMTSIENVILKRRLKTSTKNGNVTNVLRANAAASWNSTLSSQFCQLPTRT